MSRVILVLGGARSGKSTYALQLANRLDKKVAFIATCRPLDKEMKERIEIHKKSRPPHWTTFEEHKDPAPLLKKIGSKFNVVIIDCLTLFISNLLSEGLKDSAIEAKAHRMLNVLKIIKSKSIIVSNEVGLGIIPGNKLGRRFRDLAGKVNQIAAREADEVFFMAAGLPLRIKER